MSNSAYDPVTAVDEAAATGETARIFADIRSTMDIPLITSIWRGLDGIENDLPALRACQPAELTAGVYGSCRIKSEVVASDEREAGRRAILNFGHTFGHAIESGLGYGKWLHGEAVGAGMVMAADLSARCGRIDTARVSRLEQACERAGLPVRGPAWPAGRYLELMAVDKKSVRGVPRFVLLDGPGAASLQTVGREPVVATLEALATEVQPA